MMGGVRKGQPPEFHFPSGAIIRTGHLKDEKAFNKYKGHEYQKIIIEELTQIPTERQYQQLIGSLRSTSSELTPQIFATTNPDGPGKKWVKARFRIDNPLQWDEEFDSEVAGRKRIFVSAKIDDNPVLMEKDPGYVAYLESLPEDLRAAWREGSWDNFDIEGAYYTKELAEARKAGRMTNVPHDPAIPVFTVWDLGISDSMAIGFFQKVGFEFRMIDYYENSGEGFPHYVQVLKEKNYTYGKHFAPHDISVRELGTGKSRLETAASLGINFDIVPSMPVQDGIDAARNLVKKAWFDFTKTEPFLDALSQYRRVWDDKMGTFKDRPYHDWTSHAADMWRYAALVEGEMTSLYVRDAHLRMEQARKNKQIIH